MGRNGISVQIIRYHQVTIQVPFGAIWGRSLVAFLQAKKPLNSVPKRHTKLRPQTAQFTPSALYKYNMVSMESKLLSMPQDLTGTPQNNLLFRPHL